MNESLKRFGYQCQDQMRDFTEGQTQLEIIPEILEMFAQFRLSETFIKYLFEIKHRILEKNSMKIFHSFLLSLILFNRKLIKTNER